MSKRKTWDNYCFATAVPHGVYETEEEGWLEIPMVLFFVMYKKCHEEF
jgi:hypothetical protein